MSVFCGVVCFNNTFYCKHTVDAMLNNAVKSSNGIIQLWSDQDITLGQTAENNILKIDTLPLHENLNKHTIVGHVRLNNRITLCTTLNISESSLSLMNDAGLVLNAYQKWGEAFVEYLSGDFAFAIWDANIQRLICVRDHMGTKQLYYTHKGEKFIFSSDINSILAIEDVEIKINYNKLATYVVKAAKHLFWEETWFENIYSLPAASVFTIDANGIKKSKYWTPGIGKELRFKNDSEFTDAFCEILFKAIGDRLSDDFPVSALLSGGLDSSSVVSVAAKILEKQNRQLHTFSAVLPNENDMALTDERYYIDCFKQFPNVNINYITASGKGFFSNIDSFSSAISPERTSRMYLYDAFAEEANKIGSKVILDGVGGELGITTYAVGGYAEMFQTLHWGQLTTEIFARKKVKGQSLLSTINAFVLQPLIARAGKNANITINPNHSIHADLAEKLIDQLQGQKQNILEYHSVVGTSHKRNQLESLLRGQNKSFGEHTINGINFATPLKDKRLLEFCLSVPLQYKIRNGYDRSTVRIGLNKILPSEIQWRTSKTPFSPDYVRRYKAQLPEVKDFLESIKPNDPIRHIVDVEKLKKWLNLPIEDDELYTYAERVARDFVPDGIYLICFLRRFAEFNC